MTNTHAAIILVCVGFVMSFVLGCAPTLAAAKGALNAQTCVLNALIGDIETAYAAALTDCVDDTNSVDAYEVCADEVDDVFGPAFDAHREAVAAWDVAASAVRTAQAMLAAGKSPDVSHLIELVDEVMRLEAALRQVLGGL